jgi:hypothetical protein
MMHLGCTDPLLKHNVVRVRIMRILYYFTVVRSTG